MDIMSTEEVDARTVSFVGWVTAQALKYVRAGLMYSNLFHTRTHGVNPARILSENTRYIIKLNVSSLP